MDRELEKIPGVLWGFSQPISDNLEEAVSGVKGALAVKIYGDDLKTLEAKADEIASRHATHSEAWRILASSGSSANPISTSRSTAIKPRATASMSPMCRTQFRLPSEVTPSARCSIGEQRYDLVLRYLPPYRDTKEAIEKIRLLAPSGERVSLAQLTKIKVLDGGSEIYREENSRYVAVKFSVRGRDLGSTVDEAIKKVNASVKLPTGYTLDWAGEYESAKRSQRRLLIVLPLTILLIYIILYTMFKSVKWALLILTNIAMAPIGGLLALLVTGTNFSVSSGVGFLALFGVSVQIGVIMVEYINQLRARGYDIEEAAVEGAVLRLRPIMMTMLVATLGLLPAALSHGIGSDSQRPFAIVIVGGLIADLIISVILLPTLYAWFARSDDRLPEADPNEAV